jgi:carbamoyltransferase
MALAAPGDLEAFGTCSKSASHSRATASPWTLPCSWSGSCRRTIHARLSPRFVTAPCPPRDPYAPIVQVHRDLVAALRERTDAVPLAHPEHIQAHRIADAATETTGIPNKLYSRLY